MEPETLGSWLEFGLLRVMVVKMENIGRREDERRFEEVDERYGTHQSIKLEVSPTLKASNTRWTSGRRDQEFLSLSVAWNRQFLASPENLSISSRRMYTSRSMVGSLLRTDFLVGYQTITASWLASAASLQAAKARSHMLSSAKSTRCILAQTLPSLWVSTDGT